MLGDALQHVGQLGLQVQVLSLAEPTRLINRSRSFSAGIGTDKQVVLGLCQVWHKPKNWLRLFAGSLRSGKRAAAIMSLIQSARLNGYDPYAYPKDVLTRLPTQQASEIDQLLPYHRWQPF